MKLTLFNLILVRQVYIWTAVRVRTYQWIVVTHEFHSSFHWNTTNILGAFFTTYRLPQSVLLHITFSLLLTFKVENNRKHICILGDLKTTTYFCLPTMILFSFRPFSPHFFHLYLYFTLHLHISFPIVGSWKQLRKVYFLCSGEKRVPPRSAHLVEWYFFFWKEVLFIVTSAIWPLETGPSYSLRRPQWLLLRSILWASTHDSTEIRRQ